MRHRLFAIVLVALLGFAQHAALAHGIGHAGEAVHSGHSDHSAGKLPGCDFDAVYGEVLGALGTVAAAGVLAGAGGTAELPGLAAALHSATPPAPRSRGPPALS